MELDHVLVAVTDLATSAREFETRFGLASMEGGRHPGWGTANRIVPLEASYLELIAVVDEAVAAECSFGRWVSGAATSAGRPLGWAVRIEVLDPIARRLGLAVNNGSRETPSGEVLRWRTAGIDRAVAESSHPFFIEWGAGVRHPGAAAVDHPAGSVRISQLRIHGDPGSLAEWLGDHTLPIVVRPGSASVAAIALSTRDGEIVVGDAP